MAIRAANIVAPVLAATKVVVLFPAGVTPQTSLRSFFRRLCFEGNNFAGIAVFCVGPPGTMARLATRNFGFPTIYFDELSVRSVREGLELIFMTGFATFAADIVLWILNCNSCLLRFKRSRRIAGHQ